MFGRPRRLARIDKKGRVSCSTCLNPPRQADERLNSRLAEFGTKFECGSDATRINPTMGVKACAVTASVQPLR